MSSDLLTTGQVTERFGLAVSTLHYWERRGILTPALRRSGRRYYGPDQLHRLALIQIWQDTGLMSLDEIAAVLAGRTETTDWRQTITHRIDTIDQQLRRLTDARAYLTHMLNCPRDTPAVHCPKLRAEVTRHLTARWGSRRSG